MDIMCHIEQVNQSVADAEIDVLESLIEVYSKAIQIIHESDETVDLSSFDIFQEGDILNQAKGYPSESIIKRILLFLPRLIKAIIKKIRSCILNKKIKSILKGKRGEELVTLDFNPFIYAQYLGEQVYYFMGIKYYIDLDMDDVSFTKELTKWLRNGFDASYDASRKAYERITDEFDSLISKQITRPRKDFIMAIKSISKHLKDDTENDDWEKIFMKVDNAVSTNEGLLNDNLGRFLELYIAEFSKNLSKFNSSWTPEILDKIVNGAISTLPESSDKEIVPYHRAEIAWYHYR